VVSLGELDRLFVGRGILIVRRLFGLFCSRHGGESQVRCARKRFIWLMRLNLTFCLTRSSAVRA
jgi:hypothetical protein